MLQEVTADCRKADRPIALWKTVPLEELHQVRDQAQQAQIELISSELRGGELPRTERLVGFLEEVFDRPTSLVRLVNLRRTPMMLIGHDGVIEDLGPPAEPPLLHLLLPAAAFDQDHRDQHREVLEQVHFAATTQASVLIVALPVAHLSLLQQR